MSTITAGPISGLTDEQRDFQTAIRDFADRECGTVEQRERLTRGYEELHNQEIYEKLGELGWLGVSIGEEYGGAGAGMVDACIFLEETMRGLIPIAGYGVSLIVAGAYERGRPGYPEEAVRWMVGKLPLAVVDLGAGTGKLTRTLVALGHRVVAVEPGSRFAYRWAPFTDPDGEEPVDGNSTLVEFTLQPERDATRLRVVESGFASLATSAEQRAENLNGNTQGWEHETGELREYAEKVAV